MIHPDIAYLKQFVKESDPRLDYKTIGRIGRGTYGDVYKASLRATKEPVAIKIIKINPKDEIRSICQEIHTLRECRHPNIVQFYGSYLSIIDILLPITSFSKPQDMNRPLEEKCIAFICRETLRGLKFMHAQGRIHRDIKGANILLTDDGRVKVADFGVAAQLSSSSAKRKTLIGTPYWMAPEMISLDMHGSGYDGKCDIWAVGITAIEYAESEPPLYHLDSRVVLRIIGKSGYQSPSLKHPQRWSASFNDFVTVCLIKDERRRPTAEKLLSHPFVIDPSLSTALTQRLLASKRAMEAQAEANRQAENNKADGAAAADPLAKPPIPPAPLPLRPRTPPLPPQLPNNGLFGGKKAAAPPPAKPQVLPPSFHSSDYLVFQPTVAGVISNRPPVNINQAPSGQQPSAANNLQAGQAALIEHTDLSSISSPTITTNQVRVLVGPSRPSPPPLPPKTTAANNGASVVCRVKDDQQAPLAEQEQRTSTASCGVEDSEDELLRSSGSSGSNSPEGNGLPNDSQPPTTQIPSSLMDEVMSEVDKMNLQSNLPNAVNSSVDGNAVRPSRPIGIRAFDQSSSDPLSVTSPSLSNRPKRRAPPPPPAFGQASDHLVKSNGSSSSSGAFQRSRSASDATPPLRPPPPRLDDSTSRQTSRLTNQLTLDEGNGLPFTPRVHMGAGLSLIFEGCPLKINGTATWINPETLHQHILFGTNDGIYYLDLTDIADCTLELLFARQCIWLCVIKDTLMSLSGQKPQLYTHNLVSLMKSKGSLQPRGLLKRFKPGVRVPDTRGCHLAAVIRNPFNAVKYLCTVVESTIICLEWYPPRSTFIEVKRITVPNLPSPLLNFDLIIAPNQTLPLVCLGVFASTSSDPDQYRLNTINLNLDSDVCVEASAESRLSLVKVVQLEYDSLLLCFPKYATIVDLDGRVKASREGRQSHLTFPSTVQSIVCLHDSILVFHTHGVLGLGFDGQVTQDITDTARVFRLLGSDKNEVLECRPSEDPMSNSNIYLLTGHKDS